MARTLVFENNTVFKLEDKSEKLKVSEGTVYLFAVKNLPDGKTGARHEYGAYSSGMLIPCITGSQKYQIILVGTRSKVEAVSASKEEIEENEKKNEEFLKKLDAEEEQQKISSVQQQVLSDVYYQKSLRNITSVINPKNAKNDVFDADDEPLVKAFKVVANEMNLEAKSIPGRTYACTKSGVLELAKDNTIRVREIVLKGKWFKKDNGHLIAFYNPNEAVEVEDGYDIQEKCVPVALIRNGLKGYLLVNPQDGTEVMVTEENANRIYPKSFMLYKALPDEKMKFRQILKFVFSDIKFDILRFALISLMCTLIGLVTPEITRNFIDYIIPNAAKNQALLICIIVLVVNFSSMVGSIAKSFASLRMETRSTNSLESAVVDRMLKLPVDFFKDYTSGDLADRVSGVTAMQKQIFSIFMSVVMNFVFCFVYLIQEVRYCKPFAGWGALFCLAPVLVSVISCLVTWKWERLLIDSGGKISGMLLQFLNGIEKITNSNSHKRVFAQWEKENIRQTKFGYSIQKASNVVALFNVAFPTIVSVLFYFLYSRAVKSNSMPGLSTGTFMAFLSAYGSFQGAILGITGSLLEMRNLIPMGKRVAPLLKEMPEIESSKPSVAKLNGDIEVNHLNFRYNPDGPLILKDINISVHPGEFVAIVGSSGAGKSTLLRMLLGFEKPESGSIFYDSQDINSFDIGSIRRQMGVVLQNDTVLAGSILQNIVGSSGKSEKEAWEAAKKVAFDKDIHQMPMGMFTMIPAGGLSLSGGQLQRLIIARAIIRNPNVMIFDEATSALDNITQSVVRQSLDELKVTRIVIAHRLSTIINADRIYVMKDGQIIETGTYDELMKMNGWFTQMAKRQEA